MSQDFSASVVGWLDKLICFISYTEGALLKRSEDKNWHHMKSANETIKAGENEENELQALALEYGDEDVDVNEDFEAEEGESENTTTSDVDVARELERVNKEEKIINKWQKVIDDILEKTKRAVDFIDKVITLLETSLQELRAEKETCDKRKDEFKMTYFD